MTTDESDTVNPYDLRLDIPFRGMVGCLVMQAASQRGMLQSIAQEMLQNLPVEAEKYQLIDQANIASLLYCLFVVPREVLKLSPNDALFRTLDELDPLQYFSISRRPDKFLDAPSYWLIAALRNSIAHALFEIDGENNWQFWTERNPVWEARASKTRLMAFLLKFGFQFVEKCLSRKRIEQAHERRQIGHAPFRRAPYLRVMCDVRQNEVAVGSPGSGQ
jgi:hypothetical protein